MLVSPRFTNRSASVVYVAWPLMTCPTSWPSSTRCCSGSRASRARRCSRRRTASRSPPPSRSLPASASRRAPAACGQSSVASTSSYSALSFGRCRAFTRTASAVKSCRTPRSPRKPSTLRVTSSRPGTARSVWSAARSAGCSHATGAIPVSVRVLVATERVAVIRMPCSRSAIRSPTSSTPHDSRISPWLMPSALRRASSTDAWVMLAGWLMRLSTPPSDSASENTRTRSENAVAARSRLPDLHRDHAAEARHLPLRELVLRMRLEPRIDDVLVTDFLREPFRDRRVRSRRGAPCAGAASSFRAARAMRPSGPGPRPRR